MRWLRATFALVCVLSGAAVACNEKAIKQQPDAATPGGITADQAQKPVAKFGDHVITLGEFAQVLADMPEYERLRFQGLEKRKELLRTMIDVQLIADEAKRLGLDKDPIVAEEMRQVLVNWMRGKLLTDLPAPAALPMADVRAYYDGHIDDYREPERRRVVQIVAKDEATAKKAAEEAKAAGASGWGALVAKYSQEKPAGTEAPELSGDVGYLTAMTDPHPAVSPKASDEMRTQAFALGSVGDVSGPFKDALGWHVIRMVAKNDARDQSFGDAERSIRIRLLQDLRTAKEQALIEETRKQVKVEVDEQALDALAASLTVSPPASSAPAPSTSAAPTTSASASPSSSTSGAASTKASAAPKASTSASLKKP